MASAVLLLIGAIVFLLVVPPRYEREATVLIKDETSGGGILSSMMGGMGMLAGMAGLNISSNVLNEIEIMSAPATIEKVVEKMDIGTRYQAYDGLMKCDLWKETLPVKMTFPTLTKNDGAYMKMDLKKDGTFTLYKFRKNGDKLSGEVSGRVGEVTQTPIGKVSVIKTKYFDQCFAEDDEIIIRITK